MKRWRIRVLNTGQETRQPIWLARGHPYTTDEEDARDFESESHARAKAEKLQARSENGERFQVEPYEDDNPAPAA